MMTTDPITQALDHTDQLTQAATDGPWRVDRPDGDPEEMPYLIHLKERNGVLRGIYIGEGIDLDEDAYFISHARTALPQYAAAVRAVLELHRRFGLYELEDVCQDGSDEHIDEKHHECSDEIGEFYCEDLPVGAVCEHCRDEDGQRVEYPCPTVTAVAEKLGITL